MLCIFTELTKKLFVVFYKNQRKKQSEGGEWEKISCLNPSLDRAG
jgi:hypothetical protein